MTEKILVSYASRTGSTAEVAESVGEILRGSGAQVDVIPMVEVADLAPYAAIVVGSAVQNRQWLPEAVEFVRANRSVLSQKPTAMFTLCITLAMRNGEKYRPDVMAWLAPARAIVRPVSEGLFAGVLDISKVPSFSDRFKFRLSVLFGAWSEGDHRDWEAINKWAGGLHSALIGA